MMGKGKHAGVHSLPCTGRGTHACMATMSMQALLLAAGTVGPSDPVRACVHLHSIRFRHATSAGGRKGAPGDSRRVRQ